MYRIIKIITKIDPVEDKIGQQYGVSGGDRGLNIQENEVSYCRYRENMWIWCNWCLHWDYVDLMLCLTSRLLAYFTEILWNFQGYVWIWYIIYMVWNRLFFLVSSLNISFLMVVIISLHEYKKPTQCTSHIQSLVGVYSH